MDRILTVATTRKMEKANIIAGGKSHRWTSISAITVLVGLVKVLTVTEDVKGRGSTTVQQRPENSSSKTTAGQRRQRQTAADRQQHQQGNTTDRRAAQRQHGIPMTTTDSNRQRQTATDRQTDRAAEQ